MKPGFTLVELMIAVLLLALLTSAAALSLDGRIKLTRAHDTLEQLRSFDASTRLLSKRYERGVREVMDLSANTLARLENPNDDTPNAQVPLPSGMWIDEVRIGGRIYSNGELVTIDMSAMGMSPSYAVRIRGPEVDRWVVIAGLTGDMTEASDESTVAMLMDNGTGGADGRRPRSSGTTLIEVLAGLVVLSTLLVSVCIARGRFLTQWADADKRLAATKSADELLSNWLSKPDTLVPVPAQELLNGNSGFFWRTSAINDSSAAKVNATIIRLEVFESARPGAVPVFTVDFLRHIYPKLRVVTPPPSKPGRLP